MNTALVLLAASVIVVPCALTILVRDQRIGAEASASRVDGPASPHPSRLRVLVEAALPFIGIVVLLGLAWAA